MNHKILQRLLDFEQFHKSIVNIGSIAVDFSRDRIDRVLKGRNLFFIVGMGRSGTTFLSQLFNKIPHTTVYHEAVGDRGALVAAYWNKAESLKYINGYRKILIAKRIASSKCNTYCESNSYLRFHVDALQNYLNPTILHLVRDGRSVIRSGMNRNTFSPQDKRHTGKISPKTGDPYFGKWTRMNRFEKVCWYWSQANESLLRKNLPLITFENIVNSYDSFLQQIPSELSSGINYQTWKKEKSKPKNTSKNITFPHHLDWTKEQKTQFWKICGPTMEKLGYLV